MIVPARNEERNIKDCINSLLKQNYPNFELIVVDDRSEDRTLEILNKLKEKDSRIKIVEVKELPSGWTGKNYALIEGLKFAKGEWLLFIDADTVHDEKTLSAAMNYALKHNLDSLSVEPHFEWNNFFHKLTFPVLSLGAACLFPIFTVNKKGSKLTLSNGQYLMIKKEVYEDAGGHEKVKDKILEDVALIENVKAKGYAYHLIMGREMEKVRMYRDIKSFWRGWGRILFLGMKKNLASTIILFLLSFTISLLPFLMLIFILLTPHSFELLKNIFVLDLIVISQIFLINGFIHYIFKVNLLYTLLHPISVITAMGVLGNSVYMGSKKREIEWKGMKYRI